MFDKYNINDLNKLTDEQKKKLKDNYPIQYLLGSVNFYGYEFKVDERVLIPRYETEYIVDDTIKLIKQYIKEPKIIDLCTGSGCIAISLAKELNTKVDALDISSDAINLAKENAINNNVDINFINEDIKSFNTTKKYNVIISNPPYVRLDEQIGLETKYEPQIALFANDEGLEFYKIILDKSKDLLEDKNIIAFEIGDKQGNSIKEYASNIYPNANIIVKKDLNNLERYVYIINE